MKIIGLAGLARSGKTTTANEIVGIAQSKGLRARVFSFADPIKSAAAVLGINKADHPDIYRSFAQWVGTDLIRVRRPDWWADRMEERIKGAAGDLDLVVIDDVRFDNELAMIVRHGGTACYLDAADRLGVDPHSPTGIYAHQSEDMALRIARRVKREPDDPMLFVHTVDANRPTIAGAGGVETIRDVARQVWRVATRGCEVTA